MDRPEPVGHLIEPEGTLWNQCREGYRVVCAGGTWLQQTDEPENAPGRKPARRLGCAIPIYQNKSPGIH